MYKVIVALFLIGSSTLVQAQTDYGAEFDNLETARVKAKNALTSKQRYDKVFGCFANSNALRMNDVSRRTCTSPLETLELCQELKNLLVEGYAPAVIFSLEEAIEAKGLNQFIQDSPSSCGMTAQGVQRCFPNIPRSNRGGALEKCKAKTEFAATLSKSETFSTLNGNAEFYYKYGLALYDFRIPAETRPERKKYIKKAADLGYSPAQYFYGTILLEENEKREAFIWLNKAAENGEKGAVTTLLRRYEFTFVSEESKQRRITAQKRAEEQRVASIEAERIAKENERISNALLVDKMSQTRFVSVDALNYRDAPSGSKMGSLKYAEKITVYEKRGDWFRISKANRSQRWVHGDFTSLTKPKPVPKTYRNSTKSIRSSNSSIVRMGMVECKASIFTVARNRGVIPQTIMNTDISYIARIPVSSNNWNTYDLYTCSKLDGIRGIKRLKR